MKHKLKPDFVPKWKQSQVEQKITIGKKGKKPFFPAEMTNRERNEWRADRRKEAREQLNK